MYDAPLALAESLLAMGPARMERALVRMSASLPAETVARLHLLQLRRSVSEAR
jgi:hypothetical protein